MARLSFHHWCAPGKRVRTLSNKVRGAPMAATARMSIALPVELKDRMKAAEKSNVINWSRACRQGIESELAIRKRQRTDATAAAARLRDSIAESEQHDFVDGTELGHKWAYERAPGYVLRRLQKSVSLYRDVGTARANGFAK
jgi:hypothetical protein